MSNYYSQFVAEIPFFNPEQLAWLKKEIDQPDEIEEARNRDNKPLGIWGGDPDDGWNFYNYSIDYDESGYLYLEGEVSPHHVIFLVITYAKKFNLFLDEPWIFTVAHTADKPTPDAFGGAGYCVYKDRAFYADSLSSCQQWVEEENKVELIIHAWQKAYSQASSKENT